MHLSWIWHFSISSAFRWKQRNKEQKKQRNIDNLEPNKTAGAIGYFYLYIGITVLPPFGAKDCPAISRTDPTAVAGSRGWLSSHCPKTSRVSKPNNLPFPSPVPLSCRSGEDSNDLAGISTVYDTQNADHKYVFQYTFHTIHVWYIYLHLP